MESQRVVSLDEIHLLHAKICRVVGDPRRIQILYALADAPCNVSQLTERLQVPQPTVSRHLAVLRESGMVTTTREGTNVIYSLAVPEMIDVIDAMRAILRRVITHQVNSLEDAATPE